MKFLHRFWYSLCLFFIRPTLLFVRPKVVPEEYPQFFENLGDKAVCYVLHHRSWSDRAVLERLCKQQGLPPIITRPGELPTTGRAACLYIQRLGDELEKPDKGPLTKQIEAAMGSGALNVTFVPVSLFWARSPGSETSIFKLLLGDAERAGKFRKFLIMLIRGRQLMINIGRPLDYQSVVGRTKSPEKAVRVLHRMMSFMFSRQRRATIGPSPVSRQNMVRAVMSRPMVQAAIEDETQLEGMTKAKAEKRARKMADEIAANFDFRIIRFLEIILNWVFKKIFSGVKTYNMERLRDAAKRYHVIYMPAHRSHFDYLLISYTLFKQGLMPPHIAAGVNLNFPPVGGLLRRGGAFYIRRSFAGQPLYTAVFKTYLDVLLGKGYPVEFFPEGGRSRTGRLLTPKTGMLNMVVESFIGQPSRKAALVPVYIGYDKLVESGSYLKELRGKSKQKESASGLLKASKIFESSYGSPYVSFGEPLVLDEALNQMQADWRHRLAAGDSEWLPAAVKGIAALNMERINQAVVVSPVGLVAMIMLSSPQHALAEWALLEQIDHFLALLKKIPYSPDMVLPEGTSEQIFEQAARTAGIARIDHDWGSLVTVSGDEAVLMTYYRNSVMHVLALPSLVARFFRHSESISEKELVERSTLLYPFLKQELSLQYDDRESVTMIRMIINAFVEQGLLTRNRIKRELVRPDVGSAEFTVLTGLGRVLRETLERYVMCSQMLVQEISEQPQPRKQVEENLVKMAERMAVLTGRAAPEFFDKSLFRIYLGSLIERGLVVSELVLQEPESDAELTIENDAKSAAKSKSRKKSKKNDKADAKAKSEAEINTKPQAIETLLLNPRLQLITEQWIALLGPNVQQNMQQLIREPNSNNQDKVEKPVKSKSWRRSDKRANTKEEPIELGDADEEVGDVSVNSDESQGEKPN